MERASGSCRAGPGSEPPGAGQVPGAAPPVAPVARQRSIDSYLVKQHSCAVDDPYLENWATQVRKGVLDLCILNAIRGTRLYGYAIVRRLRDIEGLVISEGTIYPILSRLKRDGLLETSLEESPEGPARKYYRLTGRGRGRLEAMNELWETIGRGMGALREDDES